MNYYEMLPIRKDIRPLMLTGFIFCFVVIILFTVMVILLPVQICAHMYIVNGLLIGVLSLPLLYRQMPGNAIGGS